MARLGFLQIFRDPELGEEFAHMDFTRLRQGAYSSAIPPPGWIPSTVPRIIPLCAPCRQQEPEEWVCGFEMEEG
eukprot:7880413-Pyramimonas_sp.AAC.1